jgi:addiction module RelE/StbE family toxin
MTVRIVWSPFAVADRDAIFTFIEIDSPAAAIEVDRRIELSINRLATFALSGRPGRVDGTRELIIPQTPYIVAYAVMADRIRILRILHGARIWPDELDQS